jgi:hypothetical protein
MGVCTTGSGQWSNGSNLTQITNTPDAEEITRSRTSIPVAKHLRSQLDSTRGTRSDPDEACIR